jgi:cell division septal protein FtsQ
MVKKNYLRPKKKYQFQKDFKKAIRQAPRIYPGSRRTAPRRRYVFFQHTLRWLLILILSVFISWLLFFSPFFRIKELTIIGNKITAPEEIENEVNQIIKKRAFLIFPKDNFIFLNATEIKNNLIENNPCFQKVEVKKELPNILKIEVSERKGIIIWCYQSNCFFVDKNGVAYERISQILPNGEGNQEEMYVVQEEQEEPIEPGQKIAEKDFIEFILEAIDSLERYSGLEAVSLKTPSSVSLEIWITTNEGWQAIFDTSRSAESQAANLAKFLNEKISQEERKNLEYVDLRVRGKIYYK